MIRIYDKCGIELPDTIGNTVDSFVYADGILSGIAEGGYVEIPMAEKSHVALVKTRRID